MKFDVFGVGNALLDINYAVTEEFLQEHHLQKGRMALIDETTLAQMQAWPLPPAQMSSGGSAANSMMALAMLGGTAYYACQVAPDAEGQAYFNDLQKMGVQSPPLPLAANLSRKGHRPLLRFYFPRCGKNDVYLFGGVYQFGCRAHFRRSNGCRPAGLLRRLSGGPRSSVGRPE